MKNPPIIFLLGPPGAGKTTLGSRACKELGLEGFACFLREHGELPSEEE